MIRNIAFAAAALFAVASPASAADSIAGSWVTTEKDSVITIARCGSSYCGKLSRFLKAPPNGAGQKDVNNPNPKLRSRTLLGTPLLTGLTEDGDLWRGTIYDPRNGKSYRSVVRRKSATVLEVKGCLGPFCQTQLWRKAS
ncbi:DUF2147 domain-containing protein [Parerythrobacter aestuarii]|uniref:DUF2147 domain-containing protein n=1 Tax=Parerythrobacter aestuarii TaxID=3020909 RepID=UPI0024DE88B4|nr:DUF2147 domain-containing protein [Parerythrobacter aestuarii]